MLFTSPAAVACHSILNKQELEKAVAEIGNWKALCENLRVNKAMLEKLHYMRDTDSTIKKSECLEAYFNTGKACWEQVVEVVADYPFFNRRIAKKIAKKYDIDYSSIVKDEP